MRAALNIDELLRANPSPSIAKQLVAWAETARNGISRGDLMLGILTLDDAAKIPDAYRAAAMGGDPKAWIALAWWYAAPQFGEPRLDLAEAALHDAIRVEVEDAPLELVKIRWFFKRHTATDAEKQEAFQVVSRVVAIDPSNPEGVYFLALLTTHGFGVSPSPQAGFRLQQKAADLGNAEAMFELYVHHAQGLGVEQDEQAALDACRRAADAGHALAMYNLGAYNASGRGMPKNTREAVKWYELAADLGNPSAMAGLAAIYATGDGVEQDRDYAAQLLDQADYCGLDVTELRDQLGV